jgi:hypothetical protein
MVLEDLTNVLFLFCSAVSVASGLQAISGLTCLAKTAPRDSQLDFLTAIDKFLVAHMKKL